MISEPPPVLYSFRRCPYAIRARLALRYAGISVELREVVLRDKPPQMIDASPKATVPVLVLDEGGSGQEVIDESLDIMFWALAQNDPDGWLDVDIEMANRLIAANDEQFKPWLDRYKYPNRYEELPPGEARKHCEVYLSELESRLHRHAYICGAQASIVDFSIYSFVRQFAFVNIDWFQSGSYVALNRWLQECLDSPLFTAAMHKYPAWHVGDPVTTF
ncbi:MAG: glutathione S-transferase [Gammaproteobacteria bacterium]|nr:MAG: glutathione S-transferase [Gammaproteobacteria bacterium]